MPFINTPGSKDKVKETGLATSIAAGLGSGIFKIFEGAATLGATLLDLGIDRNRAEAVEAFFDDINPFDEAAEATAAGKITELIIKITIRLKEILLKKNDIKKIIIELNKTSFDPLNIIRKGTNAKLDLDLK